MEIGSMVTQETIWFFHFRFAKSLQAAAILLRTNDAHRMNLMKLLKLLYIADREALAETGRPITGDRTVALPRGPLPGTVYDVIKGLHVESGRWEDYIQRVHYTLHLVEDPGRKRLSPFEIRKLQEVAERHTDDDEWEMVRITHKLPEWKKNRPGRSSRDIPTVDILEAVGRTDVGKILEDLNASMAFDQLINAQRR
ncbi:MAG: SocA family protein [Planctomycetes bacterium]|nr:SocA family protein [Planctomycetota bacterium]